MKKINYLGIYLPKETKDLYIKNYKTLMNEIKEDTNRWRNGANSERFYFGFAAKSLQIVTAVK